MVVCGAAVADSSEQCLQQASAEAWDAPAAQDLWQKMGRWLVCWIWCVAHPANWRHLRYVLIIGVTLCFVIRWHAGIAQEHSQRFLNQVSAHVLKGDCKWVCVHGRCRDEALPRSTQQESPLRCWKAASPGRSVLCSVPSAAQKYMLSGPPGKKHEWLGGHC